MNTNTNKIDLLLNADGTINYTSMKPEYSTNTEFNCGEIKYNGKIYLVDNADMCRIVNSKRTFVFISDEDYPSYSYNYRRITYLDFIFSVNGEYVYFVFINENKNDLRRKNVKIFHHAHKTIIKNHNILDYKEGHYQTMGQDANIMKNPIWKILENEKEYILMYCEKDTICKLCPVSYQKIIDYEIKENNGKKLTWYKQRNGYIITHLTNEKLLYIHQIIMDCYGNGKGTKLISVDHIDQDPLNNSYENLRLATRKEQENNSKGIKEGTKRERKSNAIELPEGLTQKMMKKYVVYYHEWLDKERTKYREFFKVEKHPKLDKAWVTTKSGKVSLLDKLNQANKVVEDLENNIYPIKDTPTLPKYFSFTTMREKPHLVFEKRIEGKRFNMKMILPEDYDFDTQLEIFKEKIKEKYNTVTELF
jgi:hypothetical protein